MLCFFDMIVHQAHTFSDINDLLQVKPCGGGGTNYECIFEYVERNMDGNSLVNIVIFTDGEAEFLDERMANNIPVLWLFSEKGVRPGWGKYAYVE